MRLNDVEEILKEKLLKNYNLVLIGVPGTGKTYTARRIAANIIGVSLEDLHTSSQFEFVQFHPSYDYTDFVEGPKHIIIDGNPTCKLQDGIFKRFCQEAIKSSVPITNYNVNELPLTIDGYYSYLEEYTSITEKTRNDYVKYINYLLGKANYKGNKSDVIPKFPSLESLIENQSFIKKFDNNNNFRGFFDTPVTHLKKYYNQINKSGNSIETKKFVIIIDDINRADISKVFGELMFSIDPNYRGKTGSISTLYSSLNSEKVCEKFYVPENVYIIATINSMEMSLGTFDIAMRRRFTFQEITPNYSKNMLKSVSAKQLMTLINECIIDPQIGNLETDYQLGGAYFLDYDIGKMTKSNLWFDKLEPLFKDYFRADRTTGMKLDKLKELYFKNNF